MRRFLILLPVVAIATASAAAVVGSAGPTGAGAGTIGYTIYRSSPFGTGDAESAPSLSGTPLVPDDVAAAQPLDCDAQLATVDLASGVVAPLPAAPSAEACAGDLAFAPDGTLYGIVQGTELTENFAELVRFDLTSGAATVIGRIGPFARSVAGSGSLPLGGITFDGAGAMYVMLGATDAVPGFDPECAPAGTGVSWCLYRIDDPSAPGATAFVGRSVTEPSVFASVLAASCDAMYTTTFGGTSSSVLHRVDATTGSVSAIGPLATDRFVEGADFDQLGTFWGVVATNTAPFPMDVSTLDSTGGPPIETTGPRLTVAGDPTPFFNALAVEPLDCLPQPIVLEPTFTG